MQRTIHNVQVTFSTSPNKAIILRVLFHSSRRHLVKRNTWETFLIIGSGESVVVEGTLRSSTSGPQNR